MPTSFNPEKPHDPATAGRGLGASVVTATLVALLVLMLFAVGMPRVTGSESANWLLSIGAAVVAFLIVLGLGMARKTKNQDVAR